MFRVVQQGFGDPRPVLIVFHLRAENDTKLIASMPPNAFIANDTAVPTSDHNYYTTVDLKSILSKLDFTPKPVIIAGFSAGGFATRAILERGSDPDAVVLADATYGTASAAWKKYADRAKTRERAMLASYSSNMQASGSPETVLRLITGFDLGLGVGAPRRPANEPIITEPTKYETGSLAVLAYPDLDHNAQGAVVLPKMLQAAYSAVGTPSQEITPPKKSVLVPILATVTIVGAFGWLIWKYRDRLDPIRLA